MPENSQDNKDAPEHLIKVYIVLVHIYNAEDVTSA